jgi:hypothetical protein
MRRLGTVGGLALLVLGLYEALLYSPTGCLPSTRQQQYACDVGSPSHPRFLLGLLIAVAGIGVVVAVRRRFAYFDRG